jgi:AAA family ATPase
VGPPDREARKSIWSKKLANMKVTERVWNQLDASKDIFQVKEQFSFDFTNISEEFSASNMSFVDRSEGFTGADIVNLCHQAGLNALSESIEIEAIDLSHFEKAFTMIRPSVTKKMLRFYAKFKVQT